MAYWSANIARVILSSTAKKISIDELVKSTWISPEDVMSTLEAMGVVKGSPKAPVEAVVIRDEVETWTSQNRINMNPVVDAGAFTIHS